MLEDLLRWHPSAPEQQLVFLQRPLLSVRRLTSEWLPESVPRPYRPYGRIFSRKRVGLRSERQQRLLRSSTSSVRRR